MSLSHFCLCVLVGVGGGGGCSDMLPNKSAWYILLNIFPLIHI